MINTFYYASSNLSDKESCTHRNRGNIACKHAEFINVWLDYARYVYGPQEHIYIIDNGSPYNFKDFFDFSKENVEFLDKDQYSYNAEIFLHVKRLDGNLNHGSGVVRAFHEGFKFSVINNINYYFSEADSLSLINLKTELENYDIITTNINHGNPPHSDGCIDCSNWALRKELLTEHITQFPAAYGYQKLSVFDSLDQSIKVNGLYNGTQNDLALGTCQYTASIEAGPYKNYYGKYKMKELKGQSIHDCNGFQLIDFINTTNFSVKSKSALDYINKI